MTGDDHDEWWTFGVPEEDLEDDRDRRGWHHVRMYQAILAVCAILSFSIVIWIELKLYRVALAVSAIMLVFFLVASWYLNKKFPSPYQ